MKITPILLTELQGQIDKIIQDSEVFRMARGHFDKESTDMMMEELKQDILNSLESTLLKADEN